MPEIQDSAPITTEPTPAPTVEAKPEAPKTTREAIVQAVAKHTAARDEAGKFAPKLLDKPDVPPGPEARQPRKYPSSWKKDHEPIYQELDGNEKYRVILDEIERREGDYHKGIKTYEESSKFAQSIQKVLTPYQQTIRSLGLQPEQAIEALLAADHNLRNSNPQQRQALFQRLAGQYGVQWPHNAAEGDTKAAVDPVIAEVHNRTQHLESQLQNLLQTQQSQQAETMKAEIEAFSKGKEDFDELREDMAGLLNSGAAKTLTDAYEKASWLNPVIRERRIAAKAAADDAKRKEVAQQDAARAKAAAVSVKGSPPAGAVAKAPQGQSRREVIAKAVKEARG